MSEERILAILETLSVELHAIKEDLRFIGAELQEIKTGQASRSHILDDHTQLFNEQMRKLNAIEEAILNQTRHSNTLSERLDYFERKYTGMGA